MPQQVDPNVTVALLQQEQRIKDHLDKKIGEFRAEVAKEVKEGLESFTGAIKAQGDVITKMETESKVASAVNDALLEQINKNEAAKEKATEERFERLEKALAALNKGMKDHLEASSRSSDIMPVLSAKSSGSIPPADVEKNEGDKKGEGLVEKWKALSAWAKVATGFVAFLALAWPTLLEILKRLFGI